jgi:hypothetical protein
MERKGFWIIVAAFLGGFLLFGLSQAVAQRGFGEPRSPDRPVGRFQVVHVADGEIILLDTATGDLYAAQPRDVKPYNTRPRLDDRQPFMRDKGPPERFFDKDKPPDRFIDTGRKPPFKDVSKDKKEDFERSDKVPFKDKEK